MKPKIELNIKVEEIVKLTPNKPKETEDKNENKMEKIKKDEAN